MSNSIPALTCDPARGNLPMTVAVTSLGFALFSSTGQSSTSPSRRLASLSTPVSTTCNGRWMPIFSHLLSYCFPQAH